MLRQTNYFTILSKLTNANALGHSVKYMRYLLYYLLLSIVRLFRFSAIFLLVATCQKSE